MSEMADRLRQAMGDSVSDQTDLEKFFPLQEVELADPNERQRRMSRKQHNPYDLTEDEKAFAKSSSRIPDEVREFMARQQDNVGVEVGYYRKVAARAKAIADARLAVRFLAEVDGELTDVAEANRNAIMATSEVKRIAQERDALKEENLRLKALPSMAVFSDD